MNEAVYKFDRHNDIHAVLQKLDSSFLARNDVYFGGGTALSLRLGEYRQSVDIDLICGSLEGYRTLRNAFSESHDLSPISLSPITMIRDMRIERDAIRTAVESGNSKIKFEIIIEGYIPISGTWENKIPIPVLSHESAFAEKLLANADRWYDARHMSRDIIDIGAMLSKWEDLHSDVGRKACEQAYEAYGIDIFKAYEGAVQQFENNFIRCCRELALDEDRGRDLLTTLKAYTPALSDHDTPRP